jgi:hypothetical protein
LRESICSAPYAKRACQKNRSFELAELSQLSDSGKFSVSVPDKQPGGNAILINVAAVREDCRDACVNRVTFDNRDMTDSNTCNIRYRVARARRKYSNDEPYVARTWPALSSLRLTGCRNHHQEAE